MVLERPIFRSWGARLWAILAMAILWGGCLKASPTQRLQNETPISVALVHDLGNTVVPVPSELEMKIRKALVARNLAVHTIDQESFETDFARKRASRDRYQSMTSLSQGAQLSLLLETRAQYFSQLNGRFRWTVYVKLSIGKAGEAGPASTTNFTVPVMLMYDHQRESEALTYAASTIASKTGKEIDDFVAGLDLATQSVTSAAKKSISEIGPMYFVMVDRFHNGRSDNDGEIDAADPQAFHGGDIAGLIEKLDHIASMGFRTIWLSPIFSMRTEKIGEHGAFHGYWTDNHFKPETRFGSTEELVELRRELAKRGMNLVLDMVLNHVGYGSKLVAEHPDWFHHNGDIKDWDDPVQATTFDVHGLPDLAQEKPPVFDYLLSASAHWIEALQPAGFRLDAVRHVENDFWIRYTKALAKLGGANFASIGELYDGDAKVIAEGFRQGGFSHLFDFPLYFAMKDTFCDAKHVGRLAATLSLDRFYPNAQRLVTFADNHDVPRLWSACGTDAKRVKALLTFMLTARGIPAISYGTEAGLAGKGEPENRRDMVFEDNSRFAPLIRTLLAARLSHPVLQDGSNRPLHLSQDHFAYLRFGPKEAALVLVNTGTAPWALSSDVVRGATGVHLLTGEDVVGQISVPPTSVEVVLYQTEDIILPATHTKSITLNAMADADELLLVGAAPDFGAWDPARGIKGKRGLDGSFSFTLTVHDDAIEVFKFVRKVGATHEWEGGDNRYLFSGASSDVALQPAFSSGETK